MRSFAVDEGRHNVAVYGVYVMDFDKIRHLTEIWTDAVTLHQPGWR